MELNLKAMNTRTWRNVGLVVLAAGALYYPAYRLYKYLSNRNKNNETAENNHKAFIPTYRKDHKARHRHTTTG